MRRAMEYLDSLIKNLTILSKPADPDKPTTKPKTIIIVTITSEPTLWQIKSIKHLDKGISNIQHLQYNQTWSRYIRNN